MGNMKNVEKPERLLPLDEWSMYQAAYSIQESGRRSEAAFVEKK